MLGFISRIYHDIIGDIHAVTAWVLRIIQAVYSYVDNLFRIAERYALDVWRALDAFARSVDRYVADVYRTLKGAILIVYHDIIRWATSAFNELRNAFDYLDRTLAKTIDFFTKWITRIYHDITSWVVRDIWDPLYRSVSGALNWIANEGAYIYDLITHPEKLVKLLGSYLWSAWLDLLRGYARPVARWLMHAMMGLAHELTDLIERILAAMT
ncbi:MAG: hypothetical protein ACRD22_02730 [Terriglobia bacterium]